MSIPTIVLSNKQQIPIIGLGTWNSSPDQVGAAVEYAVKEAGYTHIDCAQIYDNEKAIGRSLTTGFKKGGLRREDIFITSKLWNNSHRAVQVQKACKLTLQNLGLDYLDLYLMHWGVAFPSQIYPSKKDKVGYAIMDNVSIRETWEAMQDLVAKGMVKSIGVANFSVMMLQDLLTYAQIKPVINQVELHPYNTQENLIAYCKHHQIVMTAYSPLGTPGELKKSDPVLLQDPVLIKIAQKHQKSIAQILIRWANQRLTVVIPKSINPQRIKENISVFDFALSSEEMQQISSLNRNYRFVNPIDWWGIPYFD